MTEETKVAQNGMAEDGMGNGAFNHEDSSNLIVNYIPKHMAEAQFRTLFDPFGVVTQCKIVRNRVTFESECYGFVKFEHAHQANEAMNALNGHQIDGKRMKVSFAKPSPKGPENANLYVAGLPFDFPVQAFTEMFAPYGTVQESRLLFDYKQMKGRGCGFVRMDCHNSAVNAIQALHGKASPEPGKMLVVRFSDRPREAEARRMKRAQMQRQQPPHMGGYYSPNNPPQMQQQQGRFRQQQNYGQPQQGYMPQGQGQQMPPQVQSQNSSDYPGVCLFVYHLPPTYTEVDLFHLFSNSGTVLSAKVMRDLATGKSKGFGFVNMSRDNEAQAAIQHLNGFPCGNKYLQVKLKSSKR